MVNTPKLHLVTLFMAMGIGLSINTGMAFAEGGSGNNPAKPPKQGVTQQATKVPAPATKKAKITPTPAKVVIPDGSVRVQGVACVDLNRDGLCVDEPRIPNVQITTEDGSVVATNDSGEYTLITKSSSPMTIKIPEGYINPSGQPSIQVFAADRVDLALAVQIAPAAAAAPALPQIAGLPVDFKIPTPIVNIDVDLRPVYIGLAAIGGIILLGYMLLGGSLRGIKNIYASSLAKQDAALGDQHSRELASRLQMQAGWQQIAEQLIADAVAEIISVDSDAGVLDASATPTPKFTVVSRDGREFVFTVNPKVLKKMRVIKPGDRIVNITNVSATSRMDVQALWDYIVRTRNMWSATPPSKAEWYVIVRQTSRANSQFRLGSNGPARAQAQLGR